MRCEQRRHLATGVGPVPESSRHVLSQVMISWLSDAANPAKPEPLRVQSRQEMDYKRGRSPTNNIAIMARDQSGAP
jgi:hypothetical protein